MWTLRWIPQENNHLSQQLWICISPCLCIWWCFFLLIFFLPQALPQNLRIKSLQDSLPSLLMGSIVVFSATLLLGSPGPVAGDLPLPNIIKCYATPVRNKAWLVVKSTRSAGAGVPRANVELCCAWKTPSSPAQPLFLFHMYRSPSPALLSMLVRNRTPKPGAHFTHPTPPLPDPLAN